MKIKANGDMPISQVLEQIGCKTEYNDSNWYFLNMIFEKHGDDLFIHVIETVPEQVREDFKLIETEA